MSVTHKIKRGFERSGEVIETTEEVSKGKEENLDEAIPGESADLLVAFALDLSQTGSIFLKAKDVALTVKTNSSSVPDKTITLAANGTIVWTAADGAALNPFGSVDVTALYVTNSGTAAATLQARCTVDPTV